MAALTNAVVPLREVANADRPEDPGPPRGAGSRDGGSVSASGLKAGAPRSHGRMTPPGIACRGREDNARAPVPLDHQARCPELPSEEPRAPAPGHSFFEGGAALALVAASGAPGRGAASKAST